jgi:hypothetical protein
MNTRNFSRPAWVANRIITLGFFCERRENEFVLCYIEDEFEMADVAAVDHARTGPVFMVVANDLTARGALPPFWHCGYPESTTLYRPDESRNRIHG